jgi:GntR family transcriptional repressor for pyruvate dehydrogenase complex
MGRSNDTIEKIKNLIVSGEFGAGQRLPSESELATRFGTSRSSLREAISALTQLHVLEARKGSGTYVSNLGPNILISGLNLGADLMSGDTLLEIFEVRRLFEPVATAYAALKITDAQLEEIESSLDAMFRARDVEELIILDFDFHDKIMAVTGNATLCALMSGLATQAMRARIWRGIYQGGVHTFTLEQHRRILDALYERNPTLASAASTIHLTDSEKWIRKLVNEELTPSTRPIVETP